MVDELKLKLPAVLYNSVRELGAPVSEDPVKAMNDFSRKFVSSLIVGTTLDVLKEYYFNTPEGCEEFVNRMVEHVNNHLEIFK